MRLPLLLCMHAPLDAAYSLWLKRSTLSSPSSCSQPHGCSSFCLCCVCRHTQPSCSVLSVPLDEVITPGLVMRVAGEGLLLPAQGAQLKVSSSQAAGCCCHALPAQLPWPQSFPVLCAGWRIRN